jgi:DNA-binding NarL/FixJ family response regulator
MQGERKARWQELCEKASVEQDPDKLLELVRQINSLLSEKRNRLEQRQALTASVGRAFSPSDSANNCRVLLVDDSQILRNAIKALLVEQNPTWEICEAENGRQALERVLSQRPTLVMLDLSLPDMPGHEVARQIRQISPTTKVIICSLSDSAQLAVIAQEVRADGYFEKSSSPDDLHKLIASVLRQKNEQCHSSKRWLAARKDERMTTFEYPTWQREYQEALLERDLQKLEEKILAAENALFLRFQELGGTGDHDRERMALNEAIRALRTLQTEKLCYPKLAGE